MMVKRKLTSQEDSFNLLEKIHANLKVNWAPQDIAGGCRSLRFKHYPNGYCKLQLPHFIAMRLI